jgi:dienelactone hydrolase
VAACDPGEPTVARFAVPRAGQLAPGEDFFSLPFPNDAWRRDDGTLDLSLYPRPSVLVENYLAAMAERLDGFGVNAALFARFTGPIDPASLPADPEAARADDASVYLVDVDEASPGRGTRWPLRFRFEEDAGETIGEHWLSVLPYPGFPLAGGRRYALVLTDRVRGADGEPVEAAPDWLAIVGDEAAVAGDPDLARARAATAPLLAWLDEPGGDERADVVAGAVFTTQRVTDVMGLLRRRVWELPAPTVRDVARFGNVAGFLGYEGVFDAPNFQAGEVPYADDGGDIVLADDGLPVVQRTEALRVAFTIPRDVAMPASGWPVALYAHGTGGSYKSFIADGTARRLADEGLAVISIDQVLHGPRNPGESPEVSFFNFSNPLAARDNTLQGAADDFSLLRLAQGLEHVDPPTDADPGRTIRFDPERIYFFGHSQGGLTGPPFLAFEPEVDGAVLSGAGGLLYLSMLHKTEPIDITALVAAVIRDQPLDEFNPTLALLQTWIERSDPVNYGPLLARTPPPGPDGAPLAPKHVFQSEGLVDSYTPPVSIEGLATAIGGQLVAPVLQPLEGLALRGGPVLEAPVTGNLDGTTVVLLQYAAQGSDGHFVVFDVPAAQRQSAEFLGTLAATGAATVVEP